MALDGDDQAVRLVVTNYLKGMIYGDDDLLRSAMHPLCMQAGHYKGEYEFMPRDAFIDAIRPEKKELNGTPITFDILIVDMTGDVALVKIMDVCFGTTWTDYLTLIKHDRTWQIVMKAFYDHAHDGKP